MYLLPLYVVWVGLNGTVTVTVTGVGTATAAAADGTLRESYRWTGGEGCALRGITRITVLHSLAIHILFVAHVTYHTQRCFLSILIRLFYYSYQSSRIPLGSQNGLCSLVAESVSSLRALTDLEVLQN